MSITNFYCKDCDKYFKSNSSLSAHILLSNKHKNINNQCKFCNKKFESNFSFKRHETTCKEKPIIEQQTHYSIQLKELEDKNNELEQKYLLMIKELKEEHQNHIKKLNKEHDNEYNKFANETANFKGLYYDVKDKLNQKEKLYSELSKEHDSIRYKYEALLSIQPLIKPTIQYNTTNNHHNTNNINTNIYNVVSTFKPLTDDFVSKQMENISVDKLVTNGPFYIIDHAMKSEIGSNLVVTDSSRCSVAYKNKYNEVIRDKNSDGLISMLINTTSEQEPIKQAIVLSTIKCKNLVGTPEFNNASDNLNYLKDSYNKDPDHKISPEMRKRIQIVGPKLDYVIEKQKHKIESKVE